MNLIIPSVVESGLELTRITTIENPLFILFDFYENKNNNTDDVINHHPFIKHTIVYIKRLLLQKEENKIFCTKEN